MDARTTEVALDPAPEPGSGTGTDRRRTARPLVVLAVVLAAALLAVVVLALQRISSPSDPSAPPPAEPAAEISHWIGPDRVPPGDHTVAVVLVNRGGVDRTFGVETTVERWDGHAWRPFGRTNLCQDHWRCVATVDTTGGPDGAEGIGVGAPAHGVGSAELLGTAGLDPGWYRVVRTTHEGVVARGVLEVVDGAPAPAPHTPRDLPWLAVQPAVVPPDGGRVTLVPYVPAHDGVLTAEMVEDAVAGLGASARVDRWSEAGWVEGVTEIALVPEEHDSGTSTTFAETGPLEPGTYRVVRRGDGRALEGLFWVDDVPG